MFKAPFSFNGRITTTELALTYVTYVVAAFTLALVTLNTHLNIKSKKNRIEKFGTAGRGSYAPCVTANVP
jgi:hypothetical protein